MIRLAAFVLALNRAGCTRGVRIERVTFDKVEQGHRQVVAELDTDLSDLEYLMTFEYGTGDDGAPTPLTNGVSYFGRHESMSRSLSERRGGAVSEGPFRVRIYVPWPVDEESRRFLILRLRGFQPYRCWSLESNTVVAEIPEP